MACAPTSTKASRWSDSASSASSSTRRAATYVSDAPGAFILFHPPYEFLAFRWVATRPCEEVDDSLRERRVRDAVLQQIPLIDDLVERLSEDEVRAGTRGAQAQLLCRHLDVVDVDCTKTRFGVRGVRRGGE